MTYPSQDDILRLLATVKLPDSDISIVESGHLSALTASEEGGGLHVQFIIEADPNQLSKMEAVRAQAELLVAKAEGVSKATAILASHKPAPRPATPPKHAMAERKLPKGVKHVIAVASGKGGVGKSTTAVNIALALAHKGLSVGLLDADVYGPSVPRMMGAQQEIEQDLDGKLVPPEIYGLSVMSIGFLVPEESPMIWRGPMVHGALKQMLYDVAWAHRDVLVLDMPPGTGDAALSIAQQVPLTGAVIVSTPQDIALIDVRKGIAMFQKVGVPILGIVENMSYFECPHCHSRSEIFGHGGAHKDADRLDVPFLGQIPLDLAVRITSDAGTPVVALDPDGVQAKYYLDLAERIAVSLK